MPLPFVIFTYQRFQIIIFSRSCFCSIKTSLFKIVLKVLTYVLFCNKISVSKETKERFEKAGGKEMCIVYGYCRVSRAKQKVQRQIDNIKAYNPDAVIIAEAFTGTKMDRPKWSNLYRKVKCNDTIIFDEVSRMSRDAEEGFKVYKELYERGLNLIFLKESTLNTENFRKTTQIAMTDTDVDLILEGVNKYLMKLAENQIKSAFETAQHEVDFLHKRTSEGVQRAIAEGKRVGIEKGRKLVTKKSIEKKEIIRKHCRDFGGSLNDNECMVMTGLSRNTYYKYKRELKGQG